MTMRSRHLPDAAPRQFNMAMNLAQSALEVAARANGNSRSALLDGCSLPGDPASSLRAFQGTGDQIRAVREFVRAQLSRHPAREDAVLVASELATNAVIHSASGREDGMFLVIVAEVSADHVGIVVTDQGGQGVPHAQHADTGAESGRGLTVVASLTSLCVTTGNSNTRSVFAVIPSNPGSAGTTADADRALECAID